MALVLSVASHRLGEHSELSISRAWQVLWNPAYRCIKWVFPAKAQMLQRGQEPFQLLVRSMIVYCATHALA